MDRRFGVGSFVGWRGWGVERDEDDRPWLVTAAGVGNFWWPKFSPAEADCNLGLEAPCPWREHHCGLYAVFERKAIPFGWSQPFIVVGQVRLWGRVNKQRRGYRAQYAYPLELRAIRTSRSWRARKGLLEELSAEYGLEW